MLFYCIKCEADVDVEAVWKDFEKMMKCPVCKQRNFEAEFALRKSIEEDMRERKHQHDKEQRRLKREAEKAEKRKAAKV